MPFQDAFNRFKDLADKKKEVFDEDIVALVDDQIASGSEPVQFTSLGVMAGSGGKARAQLTMTVQGEMRFAQAEGNGPVDAVFNAIGEIVPHQATLELYQVHAVTGGTDAQAEVTVRLVEDGKTVLGQGADYDTLVASARAYVHALNKAGGQAPAHQAGRRRGLTLASHRQVGGLSRGRPDRGQRAGARRDRRLHRHRRRALTRPASASRGQGNRIRDFSLARREEIDSVGEPR